MKTRTLNPHAKSLKYCLYFSKFIILAAVIFNGVSVTHAAPYLNESRQLQQPDGTWVEVNVFGDEYYQRIETPDGYTLMRDDQGWIVYAQLDDTEEELISTNERYFDDGVAGVSSVTLSLDKSLEASKAVQAQIRAENIALMNGLPSQVAGAASVNDSPYYKPVTGNVRGLTILIDFDDEPATIPQSDIEAFFNQIGYTNYSNNGSIRDYYLDVSSGKLDYTNEVTVYYRALNPKTYYDVAGEYKTGELIQEALDWLEGTGFDFTTLSLNANNQIMALNVFYAGFASQGWAQGLWPHSGYYSVPIGGVSTQRYQITDIGTNLSIAVTLHENGHMLMGWPDLYDTGYESYGSGHFGLMGYYASTKNPAPPNPYFRAIADWQQPIILTPADAPQTLNLPANQLVSYAFENPNDSEEFFIFEAIEKGNGFESRYFNVADEGVIIWHIDEFGYNGNEQMTPTQHYKVSVEQADGLFQLENDINTGGIGDLYSASVGKNFDTLSTPNSNWWDGTPSGLSLSNFSAVSANMTVDFNVGSGVSQWLTLEAEDQTFSQSAIESDHAGFTGTGYVNGENVGGTWLEYAFNLPSAGMYTMRARFANGSTATRSVDISTNGTYTLPVLDFAPTGAWTTWQELEFSVYMEAGANTLRFISQAEPGSPNFDNLQILIEGEENLPPLVANTPSDITRYEGVSTSTSLSYVFTDPEGEPMTYEISSSNPSAVNAYIATVSGLYVLEFLAAGNSTITLSASDALSTTSVDFQVTVLANNPPILNTPFPDLQLQIGDAPVVFDLNAMFSDPDGDALQFDYDSTDSEDPNSYMSATQFTITPMQEGTVTHTVSARDGKGGRASDQFTVVVSAGPINLPPEIVNPIADVQMSFGDSPIFIDLNTVFTDPEGQALTFDHYPQDEELDDVTLLAGGILQIDAELAGTNTHTIFAIDDQGADAWLEFTVTVLPPGSFDLFLEAEDQQWLNGTVDSNHTGFTGEGFVNTENAVDTWFSFSFEAPTSDTYNISIRYANGSTARSQQLLINGEQSITLAFEDSGGWPNWVEETFSVDLSAGTNQLTLVSLTSGGAPNLDSISIVLHDPDIDEPPVLVNPIADLSLSAGSSTTIDLSNVFFEPDGDPMTYFAVSSNSGVASAFANGASLTVTTADSGSALISIICSDGFYQVTTSFTVYSNAENQAPIIVAPVDDMTLVQGSTSIILQLDTVFSDPDGDALSFDRDSSYTDSPNVRFINNATAIEIDPVELGTEWHDLIASDGLLSTTERFTLTVVAANRPPEVVNPIDDITIVQGSPSYIIDLNTVFSDPDGDELFFNRDSSDSDSPNVRFVNGSTAIEISADELGTEWHDVIALDGEFETYERFTVTVVPGNLPPVVANPVADIQMNIGDPAITIDLNTVFSDPEGGVLTFDHYPLDEDLDDVTLFAGGQLQVDADYAGTNTHTIFAFDDQGAEVYLEFNVVVLPPADFSLFLEAEDQSWLNATVDSNHTGFTGEGFVNTENVSGTWFEFSFDAPVAGSYQFTVRYANGSSARGQQAMINGDIGVASVAFDTTGTWTTWQTQVFTLDVYPGVNDVRLISLTSGGAPNLDSVQIDLIQ